MSVDILKVVRDLIDRNDPIALQTALDRYDQAVLAAALDTFRRFTRTQVVLVWLYLIRFPAWREAVEKSAFRPVLEIALKADPQLRSVVADLSAGRSLTINLLRQHGWLQLPADATEVVEAAGGLFQIKILLHDLLKPWVDETDPGLRELLVNRMGLDKVEELTWSKASELYFNAHESPSHADELTSSQHGVFTAMLESHLHGDLRVPMIRIRKARAPEFSQGTNGDTVIFERLTAAEEIEFCRSEDGRQRIVAAKLRAAKQIG